jgi:carbonic anhydrase/acetyltransferase-like protein (isoleucine patch superfamily)
MAKFDFEDGNGPVPAKKHSNGGGWVADTATVAETAFVGPDARVFGNARVYGYALVYGNARVYGYALVYGNARVFGDAEVSGGLTEPTSKEELDGQVMEIAGKKYKLVEIA